MSARGVYRGIYSALVDDPDYQEQLSAKERLVLLTARICKQAGPAGIFRYYPALLAVQTGLSVKDVEASLVGLERADWIRREGPILWIRNALRHDPNMHLVNAKHRKSIELTLAELPHLQIVLDFCNYYEIDKPFESPSHPMRNRGEGGRGVAGEGDEARERERVIPSPRAEEAVVADWSTAEWPSPEALAHLYNTEGPDNLPAVETLSLKRREAARRVLRQFPARAWWCDVFSEYKASRFLSGKTPPRPGHEGFKPDFDWLMQTGKKGAENVVRVHDGVYR